MPKFREQAFLVCRDGKGELVSGPVVNGVHDSVDMPTRCPVGTNPVAVFHTHPPGTPISPSPADVRETEIAGLEFVCVGVKDRVKCHPVGRKGT